MIWQIHDLRPRPGSRHRRKRVGFGEGSGHGQSATRGTKGQRARSGGGPKLGFEGGQMPLDRRLPKRGFSSYPRFRRAAVPLEWILRKFSGEKPVDPEQMTRAGLAPRGSRIKILSAPEMKKPLVIRAHDFSRSAKAAIEKAGGKAETIS